MMMYVSNFGAALPCVNSHRKKKLLSNFSKLNERVKAQIVIN